MFQNNSRYKKQYFTEKLSWIRIFTVLIKFLSLYLLSHISKCTILLLNFTLLDLQPCCFPTHPLYHSFTKVYLPEFATLLLSHLPNCNILLLRFTYLDFQPCCFLKYPLHSLTKVYLPEFSNLLFSYIPTVPLTHPLLLTFTFLDFWACC